MHPVLQDPRVTDWAQPVGFAHFCRTESKVREVAVNANKVHIEHTYITEKRVPMPQMKKKKKNQNITLKISCRGNISIGNSNNWCYSSLFFFLPSKEQMLSKSI